MLWTTVSSWSRTRQRYLSIDSPSYGVYVGAEGIEGKVFGVFRVIVDLYGFSLLRAAVGKVHIQLSFVGNTVDGIGKENIMGVYGIAVIRIKTHRFFDHMDIGVAYSGNDSGGVAVFCQDFVSADAENTKQPHNIPPVSSL
jgi:hypothetical protein